jgi:hypothetical protein
MGRGKSQKSLDLIEAAYHILAEIQPASVRAVCYRLFTMGLIDSMAKNETNRVSAQLTYAREQGLIPWAWVVDETRDAETGWVGWENPEAFRRNALATYRRDHWAYQAKHIEIWSEKGTVRGTIEPVLQEFGIAFRVMHGYASSTAIHQAAQESLASDKEWLVLYVGDWDPSGLHMSEVDLPARLGEYGGSIEVERVALRFDDVRHGDLPSFATETKRFDPRWRWYRDRYGERCWELDALSPNRLRDRLADAIQAEVEPEAWERCRRGEEQEQASLKLVLDRWHKSISGQASKCEGHHANAQV